jgi:two-component system response regulator MprA
MRILVVDDDPEIVSFLKRGLMYEGYGIDTATDGAEALAKARDWEPDLVILDIMMPDISGTEVCRRLRQASDVPILMLTAKTSVTDRVVGLDSGADDYLIKPFAFDELLARVKALLRRRQPRDGELLRFGNLTLNTATREVRRGNEIVELTVQEFNLLELLIRNPRQVLKRDLLYERVWGYDFEGESNVVDVYIHYLRSKLETTDQPKLIHTVRGIGYTLR